MEYILGVFAYLAGSIPFAKIVARQYGVDIQKVGSGNSGFANAERILGLKRAFPVLVGDILKGLIPILLARNFFSSTLVLSVVGGCALVGHVYPVWLRFKGGKAIATSIGVATGLNGIFGLVALLTYMTARLFIKDAALRSLLTIASLVVAGFIMRSAFIPFLCTDFVFVLWTHRMNILSLWYSRRRLK